MLACWIRVGVEFISTRILRAKTSQKAGFRPDEHTLPSGGVRLPRLAPVWVDAWLNQLRPYRDHPWWAFENRPDSWG